MHEMLVITVQKIIGLKQFIFWELNFEVLLEFYLK